MTVPPRIPNGAEKFFDFEQLTDDLEVIADWRDDLAGKIKCAQLRFDLIGINPEEQDQLADEVHEFHRLCFALGKSLRRAEA